MNPTKLKLALPLLVALAYGPDLALASTILGPNLTSFTVLGAQQVTNVSPSSIVGNVGVSPGSAITGFSASTPGVPTPDATGQVTGGNLHATTTFGGAGTPNAADAQAELTAARLNLDSLGSGYLLASDLTLAGILLPGVYKVPYGITNLSGALTLDGQGNANAAWVFQMDSSLITSPASSVNVINTGAGAGVYWNVRSSATIDTTTAFMGNILALTSIWMYTGATDLCGRALADNGEVTLQMNRLSGVCSGELTGSNGLSGGFDVTSTGEVEFLPFAPVNGGGTVPEPATLALTLVGLLGLASTRARRAAPFETRVNGRFVR